MKMTEKNKHNDLLLKKYQIKWNSFPDYLAESNKNLYNEKEFADVTLVSDDLTEATSTSINPDLYESTDPNSLKNMDVDLREKFEFEFEDDTPEVKMDIMDDFESVNDEGPENTEEPGTKNESKMNVQSRSLVHLKIPEYREPPTLKLDQDHLDLDQLEFPFNEKEKEAGTVEKLETSATSSSSTDDKVGPENTDGPNDMDVDYEKYLDDLEAQVDEDIKPSILDLQESKPEEVTVGTPETITENLESLSHDENHLDLGGLKAGLDQLETQFEEEEQETGSLKEIPPDIDDEEETVDNIKTLLQRQEVTPPPTVVEEAKRVRNSMLVSQ